MEAEVRCPAQQDKASALASAQGITSIDERREGGPRKRCAKPRNNLDAI
jgi:hypothetical protein